MAAEPAAADQTGRKRISLATWVWEERQPISGDATLGLPLSLRPRYEIRILSPQPLAPAALLASLVASRREWLGGPVVSIGGRCALLDHPAEPCGFTSHSARDESRRARHSARGGGVTREATLIRLGSAQVSKGVVVTGRGLMVRRAVQLDEGHR